MGITIDRQTATEKFGQALVLARSEKTLSSEWIERTQNIGRARSRTFTPVLGTALLAKATDRFVDAFSLRESESHKSYSARSVAKEVLVPCCVRAGIDLRSLQRRPRGDPPRGAIVIQSAAREGRSARRDRDPHATVASPAGAAMLGVANLRKSEEARIFGGV